MQNLINLDQNVFYWLNSLIGHSSIFDSFIKVIAVYSVYLVPLLILFFWFYKKDIETKVFLLTLFITSIISWEGIAKIIGKLIHRARPFDLPGAKEVLFHRPDYSFPSDHALFLMFLTTYLYLSGYKKWGNIALIATIIVSISRVIGGFHWPSDILGGWIIGAILAYLFWLIRKPIEKYISVPLVKLAKILKLA